METKSKLDLPAALRRAARQLFRLRVGTSHTSKKGRKGYTRHEKHKKRRK